MKKLVFLLAMTLLVAMAGSAIAQSSWESELKALPELAKIGLGITPDQDKALDGIYTTACTEAAQICGSAISDDQKMVKGEAMLIRFLTSSMAVLTPKQIDAALTMGAAWMQAHPACVIPKDQAIKHLKACDLTDAQIAMIYSGLGDHVVKVGAVRKDSALSADRKDAQLWKLRQATFDRIRSGLQPDQQKSMSALLQSAIRVHSAVRAKLTPEQQPKFDALVKAVFSFAECKISVK